MTRHRRRVFVDSSVFFAAAYSASGRARDLLLSGASGAVDLVVSQYVVDETRRNLARSAPGQLHTFVALLAQLPFQYCEPALALVQTVTAIVVAKDAPIIAAAITAEAHFVATYDRKDLLAYHVAINAAFGIKVATPDAVLSQLLFTEN